MLTLKYLSLEIEIISYFSLLVWDSFGMEIKELPNQELKEKNGKLT